MGVPTDSPSENLQTSFESTEKQDTTRGTPSWAGRKLIITWPTLTFRDEVLINGKPNIHLPIVIGATMGNHEVGRVLVDHGSSEDIMSFKSLVSLGISRKYLEPFQREHLLGLDGSRTTPLGCIQLSATYGKSPLSRTVDTLFLVLPCQMVYDCIIGRQTLGKLVTDTSTIHLKIKFYTNN